VERLEVQHKKLRAQFKVRLQDGLLSCCCFSQSDDQPVERKCYSSMLHCAGDVVIPGDSVLLKSGTRKIDLPFVARVASLWENPEDGKNRCFALSLLQENL